MKQIRKKSNSLSSYQEQLYRLPRLSLDDKFRFRCIECGRCCKHRDDVLLTAYDVFRIARLRRTTPKAIIEQNCEVYAGVSSHLPVVHVLPVGADERCPFLNNNLCSVHADKPMVCAVYPLARIYEPGAGSPSYVLQPDIKCGVTNTRVSVREWIGPLCNAISDFVGIMWGDICVLTSAALSSVWTQMTEEKQDHILNILTHLLYLNYDINQPFTEQLDRNAAEVFFTGAMLFNLTDAPGWLSIPDSLPELEKDLLLTCKAYHKYKEVWAQDHGLTPRQVEIKLLNEENDRPITFDEFKKWFTNKQTAAAYLSDPDLEIWSSIKNIADLRCDAEGYGGAV